MILGRVPPASAHATRTYDVDVRVYCHPSNGAGLCSTGDWPGFASMDAMRTAIEKQFAGINEIYRPAQVSFRMAQFVYREDSYFSQITNAGDGYPAGQDFQRVQQLRQLAMALENKGRITLFLLPDLKYCWSGIPPEPRCSGGVSNMRICSDDASIYGGAPCVDYPTGHYGVFCRPFTSTAESGASTLAHELGHHFCLSHPHHFFDTGEAARSGRRPAAFDRVCDRAELP